MFEPSPVVASRSGQSVADVTSSLYCADNGLVPYWEALAFDDKQFTRGLFAWTGFLTKAWLSRPPTTA